jgi:hypothetical protein
VKLYLVSRTDEVDYDEHDAIVVRAESKERAVALATHQETFDNVTWAKYSGMRADNVKVTEVTTEGDEEVILASFNAG